MSFYMLTEQEKVDLVKDWAWRFGRWFLALFVVLAIGYAVFTYWHYHRQSHEESASRLYQSMLVLDQQKAFDQAEGIAETLVKDYADLHYANWAHFYLAKQKVRAGDLAAAQRYLNMILQHQPSVLERNLAFVRLAEIDVEQGQLDHAKQVIAQIDAELAWLKASVLVDLYTAEGHISEAREQYKIMMMGAESEPLIQAWIRTRLADLPREGS